MPIIRFWQLVWETEARVIVMAINEVEDGKLKVHSYWPDLETEAVGCFLSS